MIFPLALWCGKLMGRFPSGRIGGHLGRRLSRGGSDAGPRSRKQILSMGRGLDLVGAKSHMSNAARPERKLSTFQNVSADG